MIDIISSPENLNPFHNLLDFDSGEPTLNEWLRRRAIQNNERGASKTYVVCTGKRVIGFYSLAAGAVAHENAPTSIKRNMPNPIPVLILGRLAVDISFQGKQIGTGLLKDSILRTIQVGEIAGIRALVVHAISDQAKQFYKKHGFRESPLNPLTLMIALTEANKVLL